MTLHTPDKVAEPVDADSREDGGRTAVRALGLARI
jgi:hypothetical protein